MDEDEQFIQANIPALLLKREIKAKTSGIGGEWKLHEIIHIGSRPRNIEFTLSLINGLALFGVSAKINRDTMRISNIEIREI
jgi:hypothetical protein